MLQTINNILLAIHVATGFASLVIFWIPAITRKGKKVHVIAGRLYVYSMWIVVVTAFLLSLINIHNGSYVTAGFLGFLTFLTAYPLWFGIAILKYKKEIPDTALLIRKMLNGIVFLGGLGLISWSVAMKVQDEAILLLIFGILGIVAGGGVAFQSNSAARDQHNWIREHIDGMIITGIAAYTAFFSFGGSRFFHHIFDDSLVFIPWVLPAIIGTIALRLTKRKWVSS